MDEDEFERLLNLFPVVRSRDYKVEEWQDAWEDDNKTELGSHAIDLNDAFWEKLRLAAEKKVCAAEAKRFCKAFQRVHKKLVSGDLGFEAACHLKSALNNHRD